MPEYLKSQVLKNHVFPEGCSVTFYNEDNVPVETITIGSKANQPDEESQKEVAQTIENPVETAQIIEGPAAEAPAPQINEIQSQVTTTPEPAQTAENIQSENIKSSAQEQKVTVDGNTYMVKEENGEIIITKILKLSDYGLSLPKEINNKKVDVKNIPSLLADYM